MTNRFLVTSFLLFGIFIPFLTIVYGAGSTERGRQHATLAVLVDLHEAIGEVIGSKGPSRVLCGSLNVRAFQQLAAVKWAVEVINNNSWSNEFALDAVVHDTCGDSGIALLETHQLIKWAKDNVEDSPVIGVIVSGSRNNERVIDKPLETLNRENISAIVTSSRAGELLLTKHFNVFTTALDISSVNEAIVALIHQLEAESVAVISSCSHAVRKFEGLAAKYSIPAKFYSVLKKDNPAILEAIITFITTNAKSANTIVLLLESSDLERIVRDREYLNQFRKLVRGRSWILGSVGVDPELIKEWSSRFNSNLLIMEPHVSPNPDFQTYFLATINAALKEDTMDETREYIEKIYQCQWPETEMSGGMRMLSRISELNSLVSCGNLTTVDLNERFHPDPDVGFIVSAVSAYSAALRLAQLEACPVDQVQCDHDQLSGNVLEALRKLNFPIDATIGSPVDVDKTTEPTIAASHELEGTRGRINHQGKLVSRKYDLLLSRPYQSLSQVGQYSAENGLLLDMTFAEVNLSSDDLPLEDTTLAGINEISTSTTPKIRRVGKYEKYGDEGQAEPIGSDGHVQIRRLASPELYISRVWAMVVVAVGITGVFLTLYMLVYVLLRMCDGTLQGNQSLGIVLLLCVMVLYSTVVLFVLPPSTTLCTLRIFVPSIGLAVTFGILMLKAMQLRALVSLGLGGRISGFNQFVTLLFIVAVQLAINLQWYLTPHVKGLLATSTTSPATVTSEPLTRAVNECSHSYQTYLLLHSYVALLILFVFLYGTSVLKIRRNHNEARWVTLSALLAIPIVIGWTLVVFLGPIEFQEPAASITFISIATIVLFSIFIPKLGTISRQSNLVRRKQMLHQGGSSGGAGYSGSISTIFTTLSDRGTLQRQQPHHHQHYHQHHHPSKGRRPHHHPSSSSHGTSPLSTSYQIPIGSGSNGKSVTYSPRVGTNVFHSPSVIPSLGRTMSLKTPLYESNGGAYP